MHFGNAARARFSIADHSLPAGMQVVVRVASARRAVHKGLAPAAVRLVPTAKGPLGLAVPAAMKANAPAIDAPELVLIPLIRRLARHHSALPAARVQQPHAVGLAGELMTKQNLVWPGGMDQHVVDPE